MWKTAAVTLAILFGVFTVVTDIPISGLGISFCVLRCSSIIKLSNGTQYALYDSDSYGTETETLKLYRSRHTFGILWMSVHQAKMLEYWEIYGPAKLIISPDEKLLFFLRNPGGASSQEGAFWSDLVDISTGIERVVIGSGPRSLMKQDDKRLRAKHDRIEKIATSRGVSAP